MYKRRTRQKVTGQEPITANANTTQPPISPEAVQDKPSSETASPKPVETVLPPSKQPTPNEPQKAGSPAIAMQSLISEPPMPIADLSKPADEKAPPKSFSKSMPAQITRSAIKPHSPAITPLTMPGQIPDLVVNDKEKGSLTQVYFKGTPEELIITQRLQTGEINASQEKFQLQAADKAADNNNAEMNIVKITIFGQDVTLKSRRSPEELRKLAESLTN